MRTRRSLFVSLVAVILATAAFAGDAARPPQWSRPLLMPGARLTPATPSEPDAQAPAPIPGGFRRSAPEGALTIRPDKVEKSTETPLRYALPDLPADFVAAQLVFRATRNGRLLLEETLDLPVRHSRDAVVNLLTNYPNELRMLRKVESDRPGSVEVTFSIGNRVLAELPLSQLEADSARTAAAEQVGATRKFTVTFVPALKQQTNPVGPDPECEQQCSDAYLQCSEWCDQRGSCNYCWTQYQDCVASCPQVCTEPKDEYNYYTAQYVGSYAHGTSCFDNSPWGSGGIGDLWMLWEDVYHVSYYHRTVHCDNSYTDEYLGDDYFAVWCWAIWAQDACFAHAGDYPSNPC